MPKGIYERKNRKVVESPKWEPKPEIPVPNDVPEAKSDVQPKEEVVSEEMKPKETAHHKKGCHNCGHGKETHYGQIKDWCNISGCKCERFHVE